MGKWIGQHIFDLVARLRSDVYLDDIQTGTIASGCNLGLDSNNKIVKAAEATGDITGVALTAGTGIDLTSVANATGGDYAATIGVDVSDFMTNGSDNRILTATGADAINAEQLLTFDGNTLTVGAGTNTTQDGLVVNCSSLTSGNGIFLDINTALTTTNTLDCMRVDLDKSGSTAASQIAQHVGLEIDMNDNAAGNHAASSIFMTGIDIDIAYTNTNAATNYQRGVDVALTGGDADLNCVGYHSFVTNGGIDFKAVSSADQGDYFTIATTTHGATTLTTVDNDATAAHFEVAADGDITLDAAGQIKLEPAAGNNILLDETVAVDGGSVTGITTLGVDSVSLTAVQTSSESFADNDTSIMTSAAIDDRISRPAKQIQHIYANFKDNTGTTEHFIPLAGVPDEKTGFSNEQVLLLMPTGGHVKEVIVRALYSAYTDENIVIKIYTRAKNKKINAKTQVGSDITIAAPTQNTTDDNNTRTTGDLGTSHPYVQYDMLGISMTWQTTGPTNSNDKTFVTVVLQNDLTDLAY